jgi:hypothetical protein
VRRRVRIDIFIHTSFATFQTKNILELVLRGRMREEREIDADYYIIQLGDDDAAAFGVLVLNFFLP